MSSDLDGVTPLDDATQEDFEAKIRQAKPPAIEEWSAYINYSINVNGLKSSATHSLLEKFTRMFFKPKFEQYRLHPVVADLFLKFAMVFFKPERVYRAMGQYQIGIDSVQYYIQYAQFYQHIDDSDGFLRVINRGLQALQSSEDKQTLKEFKESIQKKDVQVNEQIFDDVENIQPLSQGRSARKIPLSTGALKQQLKMFENELERRTAPAIEVWWRYIGFYEQNAASLGSHYESILKKFVNLISRNTYQSHHDDPHLIEIFLKYVETHSDPFVILNQMRTLKIGVHYPNLYIAWARHFDRVNDLQGAIKILDSGISSVFDQEDLQKLKFHKEAYEDKIARLSIEGIPNNPTFTTPNLHRKNLATLRSIKGNAPIERIANEKETSTQQSSIARSTAGSSKALVYEDPVVSNTDNHPISRNTTNNILKPKGLINQDTVAAIGEATSSKPLCSLENTDEENVLQPSTWSNLQVPQAAKPLPPKIKVFADEDGKATGSDSNVMVRKEVVSEVSGIEECLIADLTKSGKMSLIGEFADVRREIRGCKIHKEQFNQFTLESKNLRSEMFAIKEKIEKIDHLEAELVNIRSDTMAIKSELIKFKNDINSDRRNEEIDELRAEVASLRAMLLKQSSNEKFTLSDPLRSSPLTPNVNKNYTEMEISNMTKPEVEIQNVCWNKSEVPKDQMSPPTKKVSIKESVMATAEPNFLISESENVCIPSSFTFQKDSSINFETENLCKLQLNEQQICSADRKPLSSVQKPVLTASKPKISSETLMNSSENVCVPSLLKSQKDSSINPETENLCKLKLDDVRVSRSDRQPLSSQNLLSILPKKLSAVSSLKTEVTLRTECFNHKIFTDESLLGDVDTKSFEYLEMKKLAAEISNKGGNTEFLTDDSIFELSERVNNEIVSNSPTTTDSLQNTELVGKKFPCSTPIGLQARRQTLNISMIQPSSQVQQMLKPLKTARRSSLATKPFIIDLSNIEEASERSSHLSPTNPNGIVQEVVKNPFTTDSVNLCLGVLGSHYSSISGYQQVNRPLPSSMKCGSEVPIDLNQSLTAGKFIDEGKFGKVYVLKSSDGGLMAGKVQKPSFVWEFYILMQLHKRLNDKDSFNVLSSIQKPFFFREYIDGSILTSEYYEHGTLLQVINSLLLTNKTLSEPLGIVLAWELLQVVDHLHKVGIIHGDIKPDNIAVRLPIDNGSSLISGCSRFLVFLDFGRSIDMTLYPADTTFTAYDAASGFACLQMRQQLPWSFELDFYCIAATLHALIFRCYMDVPYKDVSLGIYRPTKFLPRKFRNRDMWRNLFHVLISSDFKISVIPDLLDSLRLVYDDDSVTSKLLCEEWKEILKML